MKRIGFTLILLLALSGGVSPAEWEFLWATEEELLKKGEVSKTIHLKFERPMMPKKYLLIYEESGYEFEYESDEIDFGGRKIRIRIWNKGLRGWPGSQPQIIQITDSEHSVLNAVKVGGEPIMSEGWVAEYRGRLFVYIKCRHRRDRSRDGVYLYEVTKKLKIEEKGIYFEKKP